MKRNYVTLRSNDKYLVKMTSKVVPELEDKCKGN